MKYGFTHHYHLGESTLIFSGFICGFKILIHVLMKFLKANRIAPDAKLCSAASHLGLYGPYYLLLNIFSSPVRKYRKSYCNHPGVGRVRVRVAQMLKFLIKVFIRLYLLNMLMDQVDTLHVSRYWSEVLCSTIMTYLG